MNRKYGTINGTDDRIGCGQCVISCPIGIIAVDSINKKAIKCDYCHGNPLCVTHCPYGALEYTDIQKGAERRRRFFVRIAGYIEEQGVIFDE